MIKCLEFSLCHLFFSRAGLGHRRSCTPGGGECAQYGGFFQCVNMRCDECDDDFDCPFQMYCMWGECHAPAQLNTTHLSLSPRVIRAVPSRANRLQNSCNANIPCSEGDHACVDGICRKLCQSSGDCCRGKTCTSVNGQNICVESCNVSTDCRRGNDSCRGGFCQRRVEEGVEAAEEIEQQQQEDEVTA